ncbi:MAG: phosphoribosylanthranilate isomerase [Dehalococcoidia bacterium]|jgi:phosphoribosylanthranilate isomerase
MTFLKICGIKDLNSAIVATQSGAAFLGFVFVPGVRRNIPVDQAETLISDYKRDILSGSPSLVGLFANQTIEDVNEIVSRCELDYVQLCGDEDSNYWEDIEARVIKQIKVPTNLNDNEVVDLINLSLDKTVKAGAIPLLDRFEEGKLGGTGKVFDWSILQGISEKYDFMLAGGLTPDNVSEAIRVATPWAVDVSSGVEKNGDKDEYLIIEFSKSVNDSNK